MRWLKHAFAVDADGPAEPTDTQRAIVDRICREVVRRRISTPALLFLEANRPLNYLGSQVMHFFAPLATVLLDKGSYQAFATFLEHRGSIEYLCRRIEALEAESDRKGADPPAEDSDDPKKTGRDAGTMGPS